MDNWIATASSVIGSSHLTSKIPCQDSSCVLQAGQWISMVVSDGAGTAKHSEKGSSLVTKTFAHALIELSSKIESRPPGAWINDFVIEQIINVREKIRELASSDDIKDYHCTLVACLIGNNGGFLIHIGDGAIFGGATEKKLNGEVSLSKNSFISAPENGEYSNETYFITEGDWIKHLRITPIGAVDWIVLGTDGGTSLSMLADKAPKPGFIIPLLKMLSDSDSLEARTNKLEGILNNEQADKLTNDDKTICVAFKPNLFEQSDSLTMSATTTERPNTPSKIFSGNTQPSTISASFEKVVQDGISSRKLVLIRLRLALIILVSILAVSFGYFAVQTYIHGHQVTLETKPKANEPKPKKLQDGIKSDSTPHTKSNI